MSKRRQRLSKFDEALLLGDVQRARRLALQQTRARRTLARRMIAQLDRMQRAGVELTAEEASLREMCELTIELANESEALWLNAPIEQ